MPQHKGYIPANKTQWTDEMIQFLNDNWQSMTNQQLADALQLRKTVTRNKLRELGLKRMELEYWSEEMISFLKQSYTVMGDVEIINFFKHQYPKQKGWKRSMIRQKRKYLGLMRTAEQSKAIAKRNSQKGGPSYTIEKNSSSKNMHPRWIAQQIAWRNPELQLELMKHKEIIESARALILLNRVIKSKKLEKAA
jgi:hypothetical protein